MNNFHNWDAERMHRESLYKPYRRFLGWVVFGLFIATALVRYPGISTALKNHKPPATSEKISTAARYYHHIADSLTIACKNLGQSLTYVDAFKGRNALLVAAESLNNLLPSARIEYQGLIHQWVDQAEQNILTGHNEQVEAIIRDIQKKNPNFTGDRVQPHRSLLANSFSSDAQAKVGLPAYYANIDFEKLGPFAAGAANHTLWFALFCMPLLLLARVMLVHGNKARVFFEEIFVHTIWLAVCAFFWPFMSLKHVEAKLRPTNRFYILRFRYLFARRKFFLSLVEKDALLEQAGTVEQDAEKIFGYVQGVAETATGSARKYAIVTFFSTLFPIQFIGHSIVALAQSSAQVVEAKTKKTEFTLNGYAVITFNEDAPHTTLNMVRIKPKWTNDKFSLALEVDPTSTVQVKVAAIGYDVSPEFRVQLGRLITPFAWLYPSPLSQPTLYLPLGPLLMPFNDNGVLVSGDIGPFNYRFGELNGPGAYQDDNEQMDYVGQFGLKIGKVKIGFTKQQGGQKNGTLRILHAADASITVGSTTLRALVLERPDLRKQGWMTELLVRAGPNTAVALYNEVQGTRILDLGFNRRFTDELTVLGHVVLSSEAKPMFGIQLKHTFTK